MWVMELAGKKQVLEPYNLEFKSHLWHLVCSLHIPQVSASLFESRDSDFYPYQEG